MSRYFDEEKRRQIRKGFCYIQYDVLDNENFNSSDVMVYLALARFVDNKTQECFPSIQTLMKISRLTGPTIYKSLGILKTNNLIDIFSSKGKVNHYQLLEPPTPKKSLVLKKKGFTPKKETLVPLKTSIPNNTHITIPKNNKENSNGFCSIKEFLFLFQKIDSSHANVDLYKNEEERKSAEALLKMYPLDFWKRLFRLIPKIIKTPNCPIINTPTKLKQNLPKIMSIEKQVEERQKEFVTQNG